MDQIKEQPSSVAKSTKKDEIKEFFNTRTNKNGSMSKENYDKLVEQGYPLDHLLKKRIIEE